jgi:hypothetical protein
MTTTTQAAPQTFAALAGRLALAGFLPGTPPRLSAQAAAADRLCCRRMRCPACKRRGGLEYRPYHATGPDRYCVLAVCPGCKTAQEF